MQVLFIVLSIIYMVVCAFLMIVVLAQKKRAGGFSALAGGGDSQTFVSKNKSRTLEGRLENYTKIAGVLFFILAFVLSFL